MMQNQKNAFLSETSSTLGKNNLFYGIDAPWTAYTQYVAKADGTLTVKDSGRVAQMPVVMILPLKVCSGSMVVCVWEAKVITP